MRDYWGACRLYYPLRQTTSGLQYGTRIMATTNNQAQSRFYLCKLDAACGSANGRANQSVGNINNISGDCRERIVLPYLIEFEEVIRLTVKNIIDEAAAGDF